MKFGIVSLFPEMYDAICQFGITSRAIEKELMSLQFWNPRDYTEDVHKTVDDRPYGGGPGMIMMAEPMRKAIRSARAVLPNAKVIYMSPQGKKLEQDSLSHFLEHNEWILLSGRYEGMDERIIEQEVDEEWSIGDYVISGGELASMVLIDVICRQIPGALGHADSAIQDSFYNGLLDCPHFTRPENLDLGRVPDILLSGNHEQIRRWRLKQALGRTYERRPDLLEKIELNNEQLTLLNEFKNDNS